MARYGTGLYNTFIYGSSPQIDLSIEPFVATALDYQKIQVSWTPPVGDYVRFRLLRNQEGVSDTEEDGIILLDLADFSVINNTRNITDGVDNEGSAQVALIPGNYVYYSIWLLLTDNTWYLAGTAQTLLAKNHQEVLSGTDRTRSTHDRVMELLPKVFTSTANSPLDAVDEGSDLYAFLYGFSYTLDELLTYIDLLLPNHLYTNASPLLLDAKAFEYGFTSENRASTKYQRRLVREAPYISSHKGTHLGLETLVESMTGYIPTVTPSHNLFLTTQDSTFKGGTGFWRSIGPCTLSVETTVPPTLVEAASENNGYMLDPGYTGKVIVEVSGAKISNGTDFPITRGIPVIAGTEYSFSGYVFSTSSNGAIKLSIYWYGMKGNLISSNQSAVKTLTTSWAKYTHTATAPVDAMYAAVEIEFDYVTTYYLDMLQVAISSATTYREARGVDIVLTPTKKNLIKNPSFEGVNYTDDWTIVGTPAQLESVVEEVVVGPPGLYAGVSYLSITGGVGGASISATTSDVGINQFYTFSVYAKVSSGTLEQTMSIIQTKGVDEKLLITNQVTLTTDWQRFQVTGYVSDSFTEPFDLIVFFGSQTNTSNTVFIEAAQLESGYQATDYFDGSYTNNGAEWEGIANHSVSYMFQNKAVKIPRLKAEIAKYLPLGTPYTVSSQDGIEFYGFA